jgi:hypothetical protein
MRSIFITGTPRIPIADRSNRNPFAPLLNDLELLGYRLTKQPESELLLVINHNRRDFLESKELHSSKLRSVLITLEPEVVFPSQYRRTVIGSYSKVISPGLVSKNHKTIVNWPYSYNENPLNPIRSDETLKIKVENQLKGETFQYSSWLMRRYTCSLIASNKVSNLKSSNYDIRRAIVKYYKQSEVAVFGQLWETNIRARVGYRLQYAKWLLANGSFPNVLQICKGVLPTRVTGGVIPNKHSILSESKFTIVIENSNEVITEKLFDAFLNGAIPVYFGPQLSLVGIPENCVIRVDRIEDILTTCLHLRDYEVKEIIENIRKFVASDHFVEDWDAPVVWRGIARQVHEFFSDYK